MLPNKKEKNHLLMDIKEKNNFISLQSLLNYINNFYKDNRNYNDIFIRFKSTIDKEGKETISFDLHSEQDVDHLATYKIKLKEFEDIFV